MWDFSWLSGHQSGEWPRIRTQRYPPEVHQLTQTFMIMARERTGQQFEIWLSAVEASHIPELRRFVRNLLKDKEAVVTGLTQVYSNGPVEAQVHKLKLVKRSMFGRAKLPLLKQRLLQTL